MTVPPADQTPPQAEPAPAAQTPPPAEPGPAAQVPAPVEPAAAQAPAEAKPAPAAHVPAPVEPATAQAPAEAKPPPAASAPAEPPPAAQVPAPVEPAAAQAPPPAEPAPAAQAPPPTQLAPAAQPPAPVEPAAAQAPPPAEPAPAAQTPPPAESAVRTYIRFALAQRAQHLVMLLSFITLALTGLPQKFADAGVSLFILGLLGGIETTRLIHHTAATILMLVTVFHLVQAGYLIFVRRAALSMLPGPQDVKDGLQAFAYNLGLRKARPQMGRYTFEEKMEYWALVWGIIVMGITGFMMWNPIATTKFLPGEFIPAAKYAHGGEAILAVLAIIVWHMYQVHVKRLNKSMFTGKLDEHEMIAEHPLELADIKAGLADPVVPAPVLRRRTRIFAPIAGVASVALLAFVYWFVTLEQTAISTLPAVPQVPVVVTRTPTPAPTATPRPTAVPTRAAPADAPAGPAVTPVADLTWDGYAGPLFRSKCAECHVNGKSGGLSLASYADMLKGGKDGTIFVPGDAGASLLVNVQSAGDHPGQLSAEELAQIKVWIDRGAPER